MESIVDWQFQVARLANGTVAILEGKLKELERSKITGPALLKACDKTVERWTKEVAKLEQDIVNFKAMVKEHRAKVKPCEDHLELTAKECEEAHKAHDELIASGEAMGAEKRASAKKLTLNKAVAAQALVKLNKHIAHADKQDNKVNVMKPRLAVAKVKLKDAKAECKEAKKTIEDHLKYLDKATVALEAAMDVL